jgi:drug/metabolite transporter (DMT)-like permease
LALQSLRQLGPRSTVLLPLQVWLFFGSARLTSVADATFIMSLQPIIMFGVTPRLFREKVAPSTTLWGIVGIAGVGLVVYGSARSGTAHLVGEVLAFVNLVVWAGYLLASKWARSGEEPIGALEYQTAVNMVGAMVMGAAALFVVPDVGAIGATGWLAIAYLTVIPGVLAHVLNTWAQRYVDQSLSSVILLGQPVVAAMGAAALLKQPITLPAAAGGMLVLAAAGAVIRQASRVPAPVRIETKQHEEVRS